MQERPALEVVPQEQQDHMSVFFFSFFRSDVGLLSLVGWIFFFLGDLDEWMNAVSVLSSLAGVSWVLGCSAGAISLCSGVLYG